MSWNLSAAGHTDDTGAELALRDDLAAVLAKHGYGTSMSSFSGASGAETNLHARNVTQPAAAAARPVEDVIVGLLRHIVTHVPWPSEQHQRTAEQLLGELVNGLDDIRGEIEEPPAPSTPGL